MAKTSTFALALIVVAIVGIGLGYYTSQAMKGGTDAGMEAAKEAAVMKAKESAAKTSDLRILLNALEREHVDLASAATRNGFDGSPDFQASAGALLKNSDELAAAVGSVYGKDAQDQFLAIWNSHINFFVDYTVGAKTNNQTKMDEAVKNLNGYVESISEFFSKANPNLPRDAVKQLVTEHVTLLKGAVDAYGTGDYAESYAKQREASKQIGTIADAISGAIVKQKPELFA